MGLTCKTCRMWEITKWIMGNSSVGSRLVYSWTFFGVALQYTSEKYWHNTDCSAPFVPYFINKWAGLLICCFSAWSLKYCICVSVGILRNILIVELAGLKVAIMEKQIKGGKWELQCIWKQSLSLMTVEGINFVDFVHH